MIVIIDYGMGNLRSVQKAFKRLNTIAIVSNRHCDIVEATKLVLPGVGHFKKGMENLKSRGLIDILHKKVIAGNTLILGICLGMQLLTKRSEEGDTEGLGWIPAKTLRFPVSAQFKYKVPHMGWNTIDTKKFGLLSKIDPTSLFYFAHSYYVTCENEENCLSKTFYGFNFVSGIVKGNIYGVQFHPEKSHSQGLALIKNFVKL